ncbi:polysaccharide biosynthesis/export family protein [Veillonella sp. ICM51a]|jgi:capsular polysaccharide biosynthesis/export protein|uniref:polysaccharide biosynthesis/export family protein n=1 Tax=Veillonella sp. ICM51a TaxID=936591 RepID=UPI0004539739|nr:polysaccharide biosynthesis/export family protein [Veillonella sp. ICM51a]EUB21718.1 polysaccharide biosynthesis/export protein [Veillonella sp. ICM51a]
MNKHKLLMSVVGACLLGSVVMVNAAGVEYMGSISTSYNQDVQDVSVVSSPVNGKEVVIFKTKHPTKEQKLTMVLENGEYINPKDSVFSLARTDIGEYRLSKYDKINLHMLGYSNGELGFSGGGDATSKSGITLMIGPDGRVNTPYTGVVKLSGLTLEEATVVLNQKFSRYVHDPDITINVSEYGGRQVYVMGEVPKPGIYRLGADYMNVFAALSSAQGTARKARPRHIQVVRVIDDTVYVREVDMETFIKKQDIKQNIALEDGDMIYVPKSHRIIPSDIAPFASLAYTLHNMTD